MRVLLSAVFWILLVASCVALYPVALLVWLVTRWFDRRRRASFHFSSFWASIYTWCNPCWRVVIEGKHKLRRDTNYVFVANHQSFMDVLLLYRMHVPFRWVSKAEMFRIPLIGWNMVLNADIALERGDASSIREMVRDCTAALAAGNSVMVFPEGTRSDDGALGRFTPGAFKIAQRAGVSIVPIVLENTAVAMPKGRLVLGGPVTLRARVLDEVPVATVKADSAKQLAERVRALYEA